LAERLARSATQPIFRIRPAELSRATTARELKLPPDVTPRSRDQYRKVAFTRVVRLLRLIVNQL
jgi:hypothetical protein